MLFTLCMEGQIWAYASETEQFITWEQDGAEKPVYRTYDDWQRIFPA